MKNEDFIPVVEAQTDKPSAVIFSGHRGLGYFLARELLNHDLSVTLVLAKQKSLGKVLDTPQFDFDDLDNIDSLIGDYVFCLFPSALPKATFLDPLVKLCQERQAKLLVVEFSNLLGNETVQYLHQSLPDLDYRTVLVAQTYGEFVDPDTPDPFGKLLVNSVRLGVVELPQNPQVWFYPTHYEDIARGLVLAMFKGTTVGQSYYLSSLEKVSVGDLAATLKLAAGEVDRPLPDFNYTLTQLPWVEPDSRLVAFTQADLDWFPSKDFKRGLRDAVRNLVDEIGVELPIEIPVTNIEPRPVVTLPAEPIIEIPIAPEPKLSRLQPLVVSGASKVPIESEKPVRRKLVTRRGVKVFSTLALVSVLVLAPLIGFIYSSYQGIAQLEKATSLLQTGDTDEAEQMAKAAQLTLNRSRTIVNLVRPLAFFQPQYPEKYDRLLDAAGRIAGVVELTAQTQKQLTNLYTFVISGEPVIDVESTVQLAKANLQDLYNQTSLVAAGLDRVEFDSRLEYFNQMAQLKRELPQLSQTIQTGVQLLEVAPQILASPKPKNILFLIQNNGELRPTGGFVDGVALATLRQGKLANIEYQDVFTLDKKLQGFVEPPPAVKKYLGESTWFMRDANWQPDFSVSAQQIKWFYEKESSTTIDGVVGLNLETFRLLLDVIGPVGLSTWNETITAANLSDKMMYLAKTDAAPGEHEGNQYPSLELARVLGNRLSQSQIALPLLAKALNRAISENQILFHFFDPELQTKLEQLNWGGSLMAKPCFSQFANAACVSETYGLNEANIGINKVNFFVDRVISHQVDIDDKGRLDHTFEIDYRNSSNSTAWPGGDYKAFVRFYGPLGSQLKELSLNGVAIGAEETKSSGQGLQEISFPILVRAGESVKLKLGLRSPNVINTLSPTSALSVSWEKQSGIGAVPLRLTLVHPKFLTADAVNMQTNTQPGQVQFLSQFPRDQIFAVSFRKL